MRRGCGDRGKSRAGRRLRGRNRLGRGNQDGPGTTRCVDRNSVGLKDFRISAARVQVKLPPPFAISVDDSPTPERNGVRVRVNAIVRAAKLDGVGRGTMRIAGSGLRGRHDRRQTRRRPSARLVDAEIRITGVPEEERDSQGGVVSQILWVRPSTMCRLSGRLRIPVRWIRFGLST